MSTEREIQLLREAHAAGITRPRELANFMAHVGHESGGLVRLEESFIYTRSAEQISDNVRSASRYGRDALEAARQDALAGRPEALAELMYGGRMGNHDPGDAYRYRGRGYMQLTGRDQYAAAGDALELDLVRHPELAARPEHATRIAIWYWQQNVPTEARENARLAGAAINGADPPNGLADREARFAHWQRELDPERLATVSSAGTAALAGAAEPGGGFDGAMRRMLPPQAGVAPHVTGHYGEQRGARVHGGTDFNYAGGQTGINLAYPAVHSPVTGEVTFSGGAFGTVKIRDAAGNSHEILHLDRRDVAAGQTVRAGDSIGTMGGRGPEGATQYARHVHYQLRDPQGALLSPERFWDRASAATRDDVDAVASQDLVRLGSRGNHIKDLQRALAELGHTDASGVPLQADGVFGVRTGEAVRAFQQTRGLGVDGVVGPATRAALERALQVEQLAERNAIPAGGSPVDGLLAAARSGDPEMLQAAMKGFADTRFGQMFQQAQAAHAAEPGHPPQRDEQVQCSPDR